MLLKKLSFILSLLLLFQFCIASNEDGLPLVSMAILREKIGTLDAPILHFGESLELMLRNISSNMEESEIQEVYYEYLYKVHNRYIEKFTILIEESSNYEHLREITIRDCKIAMDDATPVSKKSVWNYAGILRELEIDIDTSIRDRIEVIQAQAKSLVPNIVERGFKFGPVYISPKMTKRFRWFAAQALVMLVNFCQSEFSRRNAIRSANRRLAEVPGFPLL